MNRIEIFRPGKFKAMSGAEISFSSEMLKDIAESYDPGVYQAPLVIGHPKVEDPAYGWVKSLDFSGERLSAEPESVVEEFASLVASKRYQHVSASFFTPDHPANPKPGKYYLKHVGFLGAVPPAVTGLKPANFASDNEDKVLEFAVDFTEEPTAEASQNKDSAEAQKVAENALSEREKAIAEKEKALAEREKAVTENETKMKKAEFSAFADSLIKEGKLVSGSKNDVVSFMQSIDRLEVISFADDKKATPLEFFMDFMKKQPKVVEFSEVAGNDVESPESIEDPSDLAKKIIAYCAESEKKGVYVSVSEAAERILGGKK